MLTLFWCGFTLKEVAVSMHLLFEISYPFPCISKSFFNFRVSNARLGLGGIAARVHASRSEGIRFESDTMP